MSGQSRNESLDQLIAEIDFGNERYYNLYFEADSESPPEDVAAEVWANLSTLTADLTKVRGELARLRMGVEQLRMPAIEAIGLDKLAEQLRGLELKLRPVSEALSKSEDEGPLKRLLKDLLTVTDALDRVFELVRDNSAAISEGVLKGLESVYELLMQTLGRHGLKQIEIDRVFDPHTQMAMGTEANPALQNGEVSRVMLKGYSLNDIIFRPAQVVITKNEE